MKRAILLAVALCASVAMAADSPITMLTPSDKVTLTEGLSKSTWFRVTTERPMRIVAAKPMTLVLNVRPVISNGNPVLTARILDGKTFTEILSSPTGASVATGPNGLVAGPMRPLRIDVVEPNSEILVSIDRGAALLVFGIQPRAVATPTPKPAKTAVAVATPAPSGTPLSVAAAPTPEPSSLDSPDANGDEGDGMPAPLPMPMLLIPKQVERLSLIPKVGAVMPLGAVDPPAAGGIDNLYLGAELRYSLPMLERRLSLGLDAGTYRVRDTEALVGTTPFHASVDDEVEVGWRVTPVVLGAAYRLTSSKRFGLYAGAGGGVAAISRQEKVEFRAPDTKTQSAPVAQARLGAEQRAGPGRIVLEVSYLHVVNDLEADPYLGGPLAGIHYRFAF